MSQSVAKNATSEDVVRRTCRVISAGAGYKILASIAYEYSEEFFFVASRYHLER
ncbi:MAG TPA: hypothetical protein VF600_11140 [Abditibacteriaceae bacterium]